MKVITQTPILLTLRYRPMGFWLIGGWLIIMGIGILIFGSETISLICHRESATVGYCQQTVSYPFISLQLRKFQLSELQKITVESGYLRWQANEFYSAAKKLYYHVILHLANKEKLALLPTGKKNFAQQAALAEQIKAFLENPQQVSLRIKYGNHRIIYLLISSILIIMGWIAQLRQIITVTFDKGGEHLIIEQRRISGIQIIQDLDNVIAIKVESSWFLSQLVLILKSGERVPLTFKSLGKINNQNLADQITVFLNNPC
jgi:hypothetical protein